VAGEGLRVGCGKRKCVFTSGEMSGIVEEGTGCCAFDTLLQH
jgi:hypothetical protein